MGDRVRMPKLWGQGLMRRSASGFLGARCACPGCEKTPRTTFWSVSAYWRQRRADAGVNAGGGDHLSVLPTGQSSAAVPVGLPFGPGVLPGFGLGQTHLWAQTRKDAPLPNLIEDSQFT